MGKNIEKPYILTFYSKFFYSNVLRDGILVGENNSCTHTAKFCQTADYREKSNNVKSYRLLLVAPSNQIMFQKRRLVTTQRICL